MPTSNHPVNNPPLVLHNVESVNTSDVSGSDVLTFTRPTHYGGFVKIMAISLHQSIQTCSESLTWAARFPHSIQVCSARHAWVVRSPHQARSASHTSIPVACSHHTPSTSSPFCTIKTQFSQQIRLPVLQQMSPLSSSLHPLHPLPINQHVLPAWPRRRPTKQLGMHKMS